MRKCLFLLASLLMLAGCSSDSEDTEEQLYGFHKGPSGCYIGEVEGIRDDGKVWVIVREDPGVSPDDNDVPFRDVSLYFNPSDLPGASFDYGQLLVFRIKTYQRIKLGDVVLAVISYDHQYQCVVEPYQGKETVDNMEATVRLCAPDRWYLRKDGNAYFPFNLDESLQVDGLKVRFSGEIYKNSDYIPIDLNHLRVRLTSITPDGYDTDVSHLCYKWKLVGYCPMDGDYINVEYKYPTNSRYMTFDFHSDGTISGHTSTNEVSCNFVCPGGGAFRVSHFGGTKVGEDEHGSFFWNYFPQVTRYEVYGDIFLRLYYAENHYFYFAREDWLSSVNQK